MDLQDNRRELFHLGPKAFDLIEATGNDIIFDTLKAMNEMGLYNLPFPVIDLEASVEWASLLFETNDIAKLVFRDVSIFHMNDEELRKTFPNHYEAYRASAMRKMGKELAPDCQIGGSAFIVFKNGVELPAKFHPDQEVQNAVFALMSHCSMSLIFLLAAENAEKKVEDVKRPKGPKRENSFQAKYRRVTTISGRATSRVSDTTSTSATGKTKIMHVRRGHIRTQRYGPQLSMSRKVWIAPIIVNADLGSFAPREAYHVSL